MISRAGCRIRTRSARHSDEKSIANKSLAEESRRRAHFQMSRATPLMRNFARRLIDYEAGENKSSGTQTPSAFRGCEKLRLQLATFMGNSGFHTLLARSLVLSTAEVPWLRAVRLKADGPLEGLEELQAQLEGDEFFEGGVVLLAQLLGLLAAFIGANLTVRLVREVWPKVSLNNLDFDEVGKT
jgi:hypothetical protein